MSGKYYQTGEMKTCVEIDFAGRDKIGDAGEIDTEPSAKIKKNDSSEIFFKTTAATECAWGAHLKIRYNTLEGTLWEMEVDCPLSSANICNYTQLNANAHTSPYILTGSCPESGADITYSFKVVQKRPDNFIDNPVRVKDILNADKCGLITDEKIFQFADKRAVVTLKDVFAIHGLPDEAKVWCLKSNLFLTPQSKAVLTRELSQIAIDRLHSTQIKAPSSLFEKILTFNNAVARGVYSLPEEYELEKEIDELSNSVEAKNSVIEVRYLDTIRGAADVDLSAGWNAAVTSFVSRDIPNGLPERCKTVIKIVEKLL